jgi:phospholipid/cholesterol/gamma-HCH transport system substrate-binding protein
MKPEIGVGAFILLGFGCALALAFSSTDVRSRLGGASYSVTARFSNLGELRLRAPVKIAGVKIGEVADIRLDPERYDAIVSLRLSADAGALPADSSAAINTAGLLGERYIAISPGGELEVLGDGDEIVLTQSAIVLENLIGKYMFGNGKPGTPDATAPGADSPSTETP